MRGAGRLFGRRRFIIKGHCLEGGSGVDMVGRGEMEEMSHLDEDDEARLMRC
jgi:hypothetical protein